MLSGGEPTLHPDLLAIGELLAERKLAYGIATNGAFPKTIDMLVARGLSLVHLSLDAPTPEEHNTLRRIPGLFEHNVELMQRLGRKLRIHVTSVVFPHIYKRLPALAAILSSLSVQKWSLALVDSFIGIQRTDFLLSIAQMRHFYASVIPELRTLVSPTEVSVHPDLLPDDGHEDQLLAFSRGQYGENFYREYACQSAGQEVVIEPDGFVSLCCKALGCRESRVGRIGVDGVRAIFTSPSTVSFIMKMGTLNVCARCGGFETAKRRQRSNHK
jgi:MoaA/NifB/PqqE/SkfB family radical SAM enzyme